MTSNREGLSCIEFFLEARLPEEPPVLELLAPPPPAPEESRTIIGSSAPLGDVGDITEALDVGRRARLRRCVVSSEGSLVLECTLSLAVWPSSTAGELSDGRIISTGFCP